jgi:serine/threonine-protein kinase
VVVTAPGAKPSSPPKAGTKLGKYTLSRLLGKGAYGDVFLGETKDQPDVAIKVLDPSAARDDEVVTRFKREAEMAQRLAHPNIVKVDDVGTSRGRHYIVMELVRGGSLRQLLARGGSPDKVLSVLAEVASALAYAHEQGIVHRDVKPENVLLTRSRRAKVADFGLARAGDQTSMTTMGKLIGTAVYMSPEQAKGDRATGFSDVYAMGVMIYEAITGETPFKSDSQLGFLYQHAEVEPPKPHVRLPYPTSLAQLALECLAKDPAGRPTMAQVAERLAATTLIERKPWRLALRVAAIVLAALLLITILWPRVLDPFCGDWFGSPPFRALRWVTRGVHDAIFSSDHGASKLKQ